MKKAKEPTKALLVHFPISLVEKVEKSAKENQRSVVKEIIWRLQQSYVPSNHDDSVFIAERAKQS